MSNRHPIQPTGERFVRSAITAALLLVLAGGSLSAQKNKKPAPGDPYATAEYETAPPVAAADLAYGIVLIDQFSIPGEWEAKARPLVKQTQERAISRLNDTKAFASVAAREDQSPEEPYLLVKGSLLNYRMVGGKARFFGGAIAGTSYMTYKVQIYDGKTGTLQFEREITTENNAFAAAWSRNDKHIPGFLGNVLADYVALRARKDNGATILPLNDAPKVE